MLRLTLVTPEKKLITDQEVENLLVPGFEGQLNILEGHADFMTSMETGSLSFVCKNGKDNHYSVCWGYCEVSDDHVTILAETAEGAHEIDLTRAEDAYKRAQEKLDEAGLSVGDIEKYQRKLGRAELRMSLAKNYRENN